MQLGRRNLLKLGVAGGALIGAAGTATWISREKIMRLQPGELADYLKSNFDYLTFDFGDDKFLEFAQTYREAYLDIPRESWHVFRGGDAQEHQRWVDEFALRFLMSTDFFLHGADETRPIKYVAFYHPYRSPCWNPLSMPGASS